MDLEIHTKNMSIMKWLSLNTQVNSAKKLRDQSLNSQGKRASSVSSAGAERGPKGSGGSFAETAATIVTNSVITITDIWF